MGFFLPISLGGSKIYAMSEDISSGRFKNSERFKSEISAML
jgi:hypothetical protein